MSRRSATLLLADMLECVDRIEQYIAGFDGVAFLHDAKTCDSVVRNLEVLGEAANRLPSELIQRHPEIPWRRIVGLRNRVVHEYFDVDLELVWQIVCVELPALKPLLLVVASSLVDDERH